LLKINGEVRKKGTEM